MLPTDRDGFLGGDSDQDGNLQDIPPGVTRETFVKALGILRAIKGDTAAMRWALADETEVPHATVATPARPRNAPVLTDRQARTLGRLVADSTRAGRREVVTPGPRKADGSSPSSTPVPGQPAAGSESARAAQVATPAPAGAAAVPVPSSGSVPPVSDTPPPPAMASVATPGRPRNAPVLTDRQARALGRLVADGARADRRKVATPGRAARSGAEGGAPTARMPSPVREVATPGRGSNGRFLSRAERDGGTAGDAQRKDGDSRLAGAAERLGDAVNSLRAAGDAAEAVDPTMTAVREVGEVVTPVLAPMGSC
ncbi:hypothetical protein E0E50_15230 [Azotobacter chroococcum subsp. isscasi]|uniref:hypothetical protein n=1 Tax=Azotobacter chroococcum TaxID=353 RepID=UPI00103F5676|nr:hypothetical protein [Azotobacter chroococcum]TBW08310.1 hypothetical protein E0E50_15230 [Azotobacter chroococcum subsp. isscasi]